jgi:hypothetical protein
MSRDRKQTGTNPESRSEASQPEFSTVQEFLENRHDICISEEIFWKTYDRYAVRFLLVVVNKACELAKEAGKTEVTPGDIKIARQKLFSTEINSLLLSLGNEFLDFYRQSSIRKDETAEQSK